MKNNNNLIYIFLHLPKTGGTTLNYHLIKNFNKDEILPLYKSLNKKISSKNGLDEFILSLSEERKNKIRVICGHEIYYGIHNLFKDREARYVIFLRNPLDLLLSNYNFFRYRIERKKQFETDQLSRFFINNGKMLNFDDFINYNENLNISYNFLRNRFLTVNFEYNNYQSLDGKDIGEIKNVLKKFYFVGLAENSKDYFFIYNKLGLRKFFTNRNKAPQKYVSDDDINANKDKIVLKMKFDFELYNHAKELNNDFKENNPDFNNLNNKKRIIKIIILFIPDLLMGFVYSFLVKLKIVENHRRLIEKK